MLRILSVNFNVDTSVTTGPTGILLYDILKEPLNALFTEIMSDMNSLSIQKEKKHHYLENHYIVQKEVVYRACTPISSKLSNRF